VFRCIDSYFLFGGKSAGKNSKNIRLPPAYNDFPQKSRNPLCHNDLGTYFVGCLWEKYLYFWTRHTKNDTGQAIKLKIS
jgi:hypothetical protein